MIVDDEYEFGTYTSRRMSYEVSLRRSQRYIVPIASTTTRRLQCRESCLRLSDWALAIASLAVIATSSYCLARGRDRGHAVRPLLICAIAGASLALPIGLLGDRRPLQRGRMVWSVLLLTVQVAILVAIILARFGLLLAAMSQPSPSSRVHLEVVAGTLALLVVATCAGVTARHQVHKLAARIAASNGLYSCDGPQIS